MCCNIWAATLIDSSYTTVNHCSGRLCRTPFSRYFSRRTFRQIFLARTQIQAQVRRGQCSWQAAASVRGGPRHLRISRLVKSNRRLFWNISHDRDGINIAWILLSLSLFSLLLYSIIDCLLSPSLLFFDSAPQLSASLVLHFGSFSIHAVSLVFPLAARHFHYPESHTNETKNYTLAGTWKNRGSWVKKTPVASE